MPIYTVQHSIPLTTEQYNEVSQMITSAHCSRFVVPKLFVAVSFRDISQSIEYIGGKRVHPNRIIAAIRPDAPGAGRTDEAIAALLQEIQDGWDRIIGNQGEKALAGIFAETSLQVVLERGVLFPKAGADFEWIEENMSYFKEKAAKGDKEFGELVEEYEARSK